MDTETCCKVEALMQLLSRLKSVVVGFSAGADSTFLMAAASRCLKEKMAAVTTYSATFPSSEKEEAVKITRHLGIHHVLLPVDELECADFAANSRQRCYFCKKKRFGALVEWAQKHGYAWVLDGANADDCMDYRPGMKAVSEMENVRSPLLEVGLTKAEIRAVSREWSLPTWNKPSAACLSSRVAYGLTITKERLGQIEQAEKVVKQYCSGQVRVRHHDNLARIEVSKKDIQTLAAPENAQTIDRALRELGFKFVTLDLAGYRTGSMNELLGKLDT
jgi:pyridinium-3,5-biscarboxylic acid mononucleotide sulfurtransferase